jgi:hypothetical protein
MITKHDIYALHPTLSSFTTARPRGDKLYKAVAHEFAQHKMYMKQRKSIIITDEDAYQHMRSVALSSARPLAPASQASSSPPSPPLPPRAVAPPPLFFSPPSPALLCSAFLYRHLLCLPLPLRRLLCPPPPHHLLRPSTSTSFPRHSVTPPPPSTRAVSATASMQS